jgi:hypothetical protein
MARRRHVQALKLQYPVPDDAVEIVARSEKEDHGSPPAELLGGCQCRYLVVH